jgi:superfamily II DNA/RNA helicase
MTHQPESVSPTLSPSITLAELPDFAQKCLQKLGIADLKPVQASVYPMAVAGRDVLVQAPTGSGKTLAMALPVVQRLTTLERSRDPRVLVLCPTRELSSQVTQVFDPLLRSLGMSVTTVTGGASEKYQRTRLAQGSDVIVGTPGRIRDLSERGVLNLKSIQIFALDEVDQMLDIGFKEDLEIIMGLKAPETQTLFFSATINGLTRKMCSRLLKDPRPSQICSCSRSAITIRQSFFAKPEWNAKT